MSEEEEIGLLPEEKSKISEEDLANLGLEPVSVGGNHPFSLDNPDSFWLIESGQVELFVVELRDGQPISQRHHIATLGANQIMVGCTPQAISDVEGHSLSLHAVATMNTRLHRGGLAALKQKEIDMTMVDWVENWIFALDRANADCFPRWPEAELLEADPDQTIDAGAWLTSHHLAVVWVDLQKGRLLQYGEDDLPTPAGNLFPVTEWSALRADDESVVSAHLSPTVLIMGELWDHMAAYCRHFLRVRALLLEREGQDFREKVREARGHDRDRIEYALFRLSRFFKKKAALEGRRLASSEEAAVLEICEVVGERLGGISRPPPVLGDELKDLRLIDILRRAGYMTRKVSLEEQEWLGRDSGVFVGLSREDNRPVALLPERGKRYTVFDPMGHGTYEYTPDMRDDFHPQAHMVYRPLPDDARSLKAILMFGVTGLAPDFWMIVFLALLGGLFAILTPLVTSYLLTDYLPDGDLPMMAASLSALFVAMVSGAFMSLVTLTALLRISGRMDLSVQSAIWGRLLTLPADFFRKFTAGDLANRANGINEIREIMTASTISVFVSFISGTINFVLMFYYSWRLSILAIGMTVFMMIVSLVLIRQQLPHQRAMFKQQGTIDGLVFQVLTGISKLRIAGRENFGFAHWASVYAEQKLSEYKALFWEATHTTVSAVLTPLSTIALFAFIIYVLLEGKSQPDFNLTDFLAFNSAFGQFMGVMLGMTAALATIIEVIPLYERVQPIVETAPEQSAGRVVLTPVRGKIEFSNVCFKYAAEGELVLRDVNFEIDPGEYVAFVGESGAGKSTICRLLLGFDQPTTGSIFLDGHDLAELNLVEYRQQIGVVLQGSQLMAGSILDNIRSGLTDLSMEEAWAAAESAGIAKDIKDMPMGLHTVVPEGGVGLSGGQKQRLMIARALARRPKSIIFDEATSSLDNVSQAMVKKTLGELNITRIVIAHRLSTIRDVDRIYVMSAGKIVETGKFDNLIEQDGPFARLARRQIL